MDLQKAKNFSYKDFVIKPPQESLLILNSSKNGLNQEEAQKRLEVFGLNELEKGREVSALKIFLTQVSSPLMLILLVAAILSGFLGDITDTIIIVSMLLLSAVLGFYQEYKSQKAVLALEKRVSLQAPVIREGKLVKINANQIVPGDIIKISAGDVLAADARLIEANNLAIDESLITGEAFSVEKSTVALGSCEIVPQEAKNFVFMGTNVMSGVGLGLVIATGVRTQMGKTAHYLKMENPETEFQQGIRKFGKFLVIIISILVVFVFLVNALFHHGVLESLLFALALAIGITPEMLPAIITINLSQGAISMSKKSVIVRRLIATENLGNINILCTDKTGTLTEGKIKLQDYFNINERHDERVLFQALLASPFVSKDERINPLEAAIWDFARLSNPKDKELKEYQELDSLSFDFERKRNTVLLQKGSEKILITKGAVEPILKVCSGVLVGGKTEPIGNYEKDILQKIENFGQRGLRLMAVAFKEANSIAEVSVKEEKDMVFSGFLVFGDFVKQTAKNTVKQLEKLGIEIKILTGDNRFVTEYVAAQVNMPQVKSLSGDEILEFSDEELKKVVKESNIFYRITPEHKLKIIKALKETGETVGFIGDGVNDAPALKAADVGISVDSAVDIARQAADIILMKKSLEVLVDGVKEGRKTFGNTMKYIFNVTSSNFGNMLSVAGASLILPFLPLLPSQIIILNFLGDVPSIAISSDNVDEDYLKKPKHWDIRAIGKFMVPFGVLSSVFDFATFFALLYLLRANIPVFRTGWFVESLITEILVIFIIRTKKTFFRSKPSTPLLITGLGAIIVGLLLVFTSLSAIFRFQTPPAWFFGVILVLVAVYLLLAEFTKRIYYRNT